MNTIRKTGSDILDDILAHTKMEVERDKLRVSLPQLETQIHEADAVRGFENALRSKIHAGQSAVIAEIKQASPSKGVIRESFAPIEIAQSCQQHGAACLSVLTESAFFLGSHRDFTQVRAHCALPMIRKDFMLDTYQIAQSRALGADCVLLIVAALDDTLLKELYDYAKSLCMDVLVEVHNTSELRRALNLDGSLIGINNRNLRTFATDVHNTLDMLGDIPSDALVVTESGIHTTDHIQLMRQNSVNAFLVGEAFMRAENPGQKMADLFQFNA